MFRNSLSWYIFTLSLLGLIIKTHPTLYDSSHGFISKNSRYFEDELSFLHEELGILKKSRLKDIPLKFQLKFEPTFLDFKQRPMGIPHVEKVTLFNINKNKTIDMTSISGSTAHFHGSFFHDKKIPPKGNASFNIIFLGREEGSFEDELFIHTSEGYLKYSVRGASTFSHYRLHPIDRIRLPFNSTFAPLIYLHNPHLEPLQIVEVQCSGEGFHLELPNGEQEGSNDLWEIPSHQTKAIIRVLFYAEVLKNYTAYVRVRLTKPELTLVIPLEVEVTTNTEIIHPRGYVDLGIGGSNDPPTEVSLCLFNPNKMYVRIHSITTVSQALKVQYYNIRLPPAVELQDPSAHCINVGSVAVDWKTAYDTKDFTGKLVVKYRNGRNNSEIPYQLTVLKGGLTYDPLTTTYFINDKTVDISSRTFKVKNEFEEYVYVSDIVFPEDTHLYFKVEDINPKLLKPGEEVDLFHINLKNNIKLSDIQLHSDITIKTNISDVVVPLLSYNGKMQIHLPFKSKDSSLDIGLIGFNSKKDVYFMVVNPNPVTLHLKHVHSSIPMTTAEVVGCGIGDYKLVLFSPSFQKMAKCHNIKPGYYAVIKTTVETTVVEGQVWGDIYVETQFENLKVPVHFKIAPGKLEIGPDKLVFDQCFPSKVCTHPVRVLSTFNDPMIIEDILSLPPDIRITSKHSGHILARTSKIVGHMFYSPEVECQSECYTGLQYDTSAQWLSMFSFTSNYVCDFDLHLVNVFYNRYLNVTANGTKQWQNITLRLDTSEVRGHIFRSRVKLTWPSLIQDHNADEKSTINFPLTQLGNVSYYNITLRNPASHTIVVQLMFERDYPGFETLLSSLPPNLMPKNTRNKYSSRGFFFLNSTKDKHLEYFSSNLGVDVHTESVPIILAPGQTYNLPVGFHAEDSDFHSTTLLLRNNLTIIEVVRLNARGALPMLKFGNRKPGSVQPLMFEMTDKHFRDCERSRVYPSEPDFTIKRTFTARNIGDVTLYVNSFRINDYECEGYGYRVVDCEPFVLHPNQTKKIDIAFTPDLTLSKISRTLILSTSMNIPVNFTLYTTIPPMYLNLCSEFIPRPPWETYLNYIVVGSMITILIILLAVAAYDAERIRCQAMSSLSLPTGSTIQPVLDLRLVGQQTREEIQSSKVTHNTKDEESCAETEIKPKSEMERYSAVTPTTGKVRKRLGKKTSIEHEISDLQISEKFEKKKEKCHLSESKSKVKEEKEVKTDDKEKKPTHNTQNKEKDSKKQTHNRKPSKNISIPAYEEEMSSAATDSSGSLNEDAEKENSQRSSSKTSCSKPKTPTTPKPPPSAKATPLVAEVSANQPTEYKTVNFNHNNQHNKLKHQKSNVKTNKYTEKQKENKDYEVSNQKQDNHNKIFGQQQREPKKRDRGGKDRKDKSYYKKSEKTKHSDRQCNTETAEKQQKQSSGFNIPLPSLPVSSIWGENRAKFSDVVARSEASTSTQSVPSAPKSPTINPLVFVEPYKQTSPTELGPIGSRRTEVRRTSVDAGRRSTLEGGASTFSQLLNSLGNESSFFSNQARLENALNRSQWSPQSGFGSRADAGFTASEGNSIMEDPWNQDLLNTSSYWDSFNPMLLPENPMLNNPSQLLEENSSSQQNDSVSAQPNTYLWGSSNVWKPWIPGTTNRTPTRTPPGFEELPQQQTRDSYSPFNTSPLWNQQPPTNPWNFSPGGHD